MIHLHDRVRIISSGFESQGIGPGTDGFVIDLYDDGNFEVEVSDPLTGETVAQFVATPSDVAIVGS